MLCQANVSKCEDCSTTLVVEILQSSAGFYYGTQCECGPYSRESGYFASVFDALTSILN